MGGSSLAIMAWRNLWRNRRRTLITLSSFAFGVLLAVLATGMGDSSYAQIIELAARMGGGHVTFQHPDYLEVPSLKKSIRGVPELEAVALEHPNVDRVVTRIAGPTMLATAHNSTGAFFVGVDPAAEDETTLAGVDSISAGEMFESADDSGIILGATLAENLSVSLGKKVVYTMTDKHGEMVSGLARVKGIIKTGSPSLDGGLCLLTITTMREALGYEEDESTVVAVFIKDQRRSEQVAADLRAAVAGDTAVLPWQQTQPELAGFITVDRSSTVFFELIIMVLIAAGIFNSLFVSVMERLREFGIMLAIGFTPARLFGLVMWESLWLSLVGLVFSAVVTVGPYYHFNTQGIDFTEMVGEGTEISGFAFDPIIYVDIYTEKLFIIAAIVIVVTLLAGLYPAWKAGRVEPVETIRLV